MWRKVIAPLQIVALIAVSLLPTFKSTKKVTKTINQENKKTFWSLNTQITCNYDSKNINFVFLVALCFSKFRVYCINFHCVFKKKFKSSILTTKFYFFFRSSLISIRVSRPKKSSRKIQFFFFFLFQTLSQFLRKFGSKERSFCFKSSTVYSTRITLTLSKILFGLTA